MRKFSYAANGLIEVQSRFLKEEREVEFAASAELVELFHKAKEALLF
jgi:hypothetical protein